MLIFRCKVMKKFYLDVNNRFDAERVADTASDAVQILFPEAENIRSVGFDDYCGQTAELFRLTDDGEDFDVFVIEKSGEPENDSPLWKKELGKIAQFPKF